MRGDAGGTIDVGHECTYDVPVVCNGAGTVVIADRVAFGYRLAPMLGDGRVLLQARSSSAVVSVGSRTELSNNVSIVANASVSIGSDCLIGEMVTIFDSDFHDQDPTARRDPAQRARSDGSVGHVFVGDNVWIGSRVLVLRDVTIGNHSIIGAGAVVTGPIPERVMAAGVPARVIRRL